MPLIVELSFLGGPLILVVTWALIVIYTLED